MRRTLCLAVGMVAILGFAFWLGVRDADAQPVRGFVDENGDGYNDLAPDVDDDGIPNGRDEDYVRQGRGRGAARGFVDEDGDGINDNAPDVDDDGIPNGRDEDYVRPADGTGSKPRVGRRPSGFRGRASRSRAFVDEDGDGLCDNAPDADGDGIPDGRGVGYVRTGVRGFRGMRSGTAQGFVDADGDGLCDNAPAPADEE